MAIDFQKLKHDNDIVDVIGGLIALKPEGHLFVSKCPFHNEKSSSFKVDKVRQKYKCYGCGAYGDIFDFLREHQGFDHIKAADYLENKPISDPKEIKGKAKPKKVWQQLPVMADTPQPTFNHYLDGQPKNIYKYVNPDGSTFGYTCRFIYADGSKTVKPYVYATNGENTFWVFTDFKQPRPLYGIHLLKEYSEATVILVEGEKKADFLNEILTKEKYIAVTWSFGSKSVSKTDFGPLKNRKLIFWPDNDATGLSAMIQIKEILQPNEFFYIPLNENLPKHWDAADFEFSSAEIQQQETEIHTFIAENFKNEFPSALETIPDHIEKIHGKPLKVWSVKEVGEDSIWFFGNFSKSPEHWAFFQNKGPVAEEKAKKSNAPATPTKPPKTPPPAVSQSPVYNWEQYFSILGFDKVDNNLRFYFFIKNTQTICAFNAAQLSRVVLITLAPLEFWEEHFPDRQSFNVLAAQNMLIIQAKRMGNFTDKNIRGRGAWVENKKIILHTGKDLIIDGKRHPLGTVKTKYVYELCENLNINIENPADTKEANKLITLLKYINWTRDIDAYLLAGWCVIAPFCGALHWRPHAWITGSAGSGKSWILLKIVRRMLRDFCIAIQGKTTEAGIRQGLDRDAIPIIFDEAEAEDKNSQQHIDQCIQLARCSSSDDGGVILKGSSNQVGSSFIIRSCFLFGSIVDPVAKQADKTRISVLAIKEPTDIVKSRERWQAMQAFYGTNCTDAFFESLQARTVKLLPVILKNAHTFSTAAASILGQQRMGDQLGAMLAGAFSLSSEREINHDEALEWIKGKDLTEEKNMTATRDELQLLQFLMDQIVTLEVTRMERTVGELVRISGGLTIEGAVTQTDADNKLRRLGIKVEPNSLDNDKLYIVFSNTADWLKQKLQNTAWAKNHNKILLRLPGAGQLAVTRFAGMMTRAVRIPLSIME